MSIWLAGRLIAPFFAIIILGVVITGIFSPVYRVAAGKIGPKSAAALTCALLFFVVFVPVVFLVGMLSKEAFDLYVMARDAVFSDQLKNLLASTHALDRLNSLLIRAGIQKAVTWDELIKPVSELGKFVGFSLFEQARLITSNVFNIVLYFCLMLIVVFYMFMDGDRFIKYLVDLSPLPDEHDEKLFEKFMDMSGAVLIGNGLGGLIQGIAGGLVFLFLGFGSPFLWGVIMGFLAFLPILGIGIVMIPAAAILALKSRIAAGIFVLVFYAVLSWGIEYVFKPRLVGNRVRMHPLVVFFAILGGLKAYGLLGIIYGPLIATLFLTLADIYFSSFQYMIEPEKAHRKKELESHL